MVGSVKVKKNTFCLFVCYLLSLGCSKSTPDILQTDGNTAAKIKCLYALSVDKKNKEKYLPLIIHATLDTDASVREQAAFVIGKIKADNLAGISTLANLLSDKDKNVRIAAIMALGMMGANAGNSVPELLKLFVLKDSQTDLLVIRTLSKIGTSAKAAVPYLEKRLIQNKDGIDIQGYLKEALFTITGNTYMTKGDEITIVDSKDDTIKKFRSGVEVNIPTEEEKAAVSLELQKIAEEILQKQALEGNTEGILDIQGK